MNKIIGQRAAARYCQTTQATIVAHIEAGNLVPDETQLIAGSESRVAHIFYPATLDAWNSARKPRGRKKAQ